MRGLIALFAAALLGLSSTALADAKALPGVWLIEPLYFDPMIEQGIVTPEFPVLVLAVDGGFRLYRVGVYCQILEEYFRLSDYAALTQACSRTLQRSRSDLGSALGIVSAAGKWKATADGQIEFLVEERGPTPKYFEDHVKSMRDGLQDTLSKLRQDVRDEHTRQSLEQRVRREVARVESFYSTLFVLNGGQLRFAADDLLLHLEGAHPDDKLVYRRTDARVLEAATGAVILLQESAARYFRCLMDYFQSSPGPDAGEHKEALMKTTREASRAYAGKPEVDPRVLGELSRRLGPHPVFAAIDRREFGTYLGCPRRDKP